METIPLWKLDDFYYCRVFEIATAIMNKTNKKQKGNELLIKLIQQYSIYFTLYTPQKAKDSLNWKEIDEKIERGFYSVMKWQLSPDRLNRGDLIVEAITVAQRNKNKKGIFDFARPFSLSHSYSYLSIFDAVEVLAPYGYNRKDFVFHKKEEKENHKPLKEKERNNLHRIIHAMKEVLLTQAKDEGGKPLFSSQNDLIKALENIYLGYDGLSESNLKILYANINKQFDNAEKTFKNS